MAEESRLLQALRPWRQREPHENERILDAYQIDAAVRHFVEENTDLHAALSELVHAQEAYDELDATEGRLAFEHEEIPPAIYDDLKQRQRAAAERLDAAWYVAR